MPQEKWNRGGCGQKKPRNEHAKSYVGPHALTKGSSTRTGHGQMGHGPGVDVSPNSASYKKRAWDGKPVGKSEQPSAKEETGVGLGEKGLSIENKLARKRSKAADEKIGDP